MICFGMCMAWVDGSAEKREAEIIKKWVNARLDAETDDEERNRLKDEYNKEIKRAYQLGKEGKLDPVFLCRKFNEITDIGDKWECLELLRDVMAGDTEADPNELQLLKLCQTEFGVDAEEFSNMMSEALSKISTVGTDSTKGEDKCSAIANLIGIDSNMSLDEKKSKLAQEANRANGMANVAETNEARDNANKMIENIAYYRKNCLN